MKQRMYRRIAVLSIVLIAVIVLVFSMVSVLSAEDPITQVGTSDKDDPYTCWMYDTDVISPTISTTDVFTTAKPGSNYQSDVVAVLKCRADIENNTGSAMNIWGPIPNCRMYPFPPYTDTVAFTSSWHQTISSEGNAVLTCQFKSNQGQG